MPSQTKAEADPIIVQVPEHHGVRELNRALDCFALSQEAENLIKKPVHIYSIPLKKPPSKGEGGFLS